MADHVVGTEVMDLVRDYVLPDRCATLLVDLKLDTIFDMDDATKVYVEDDKIVRIGKMITGYNAVDCGIFVCSTALMDAIESVYVATGDASLSDGVQAFSADGRMLTLDVGDGFWQDVDTPEMLAHAEAVLAASGVSRL
jgi:1L-myo-inositol 1-phosphate cytidylyltransferase